MDPISFQHSVFLEALGNAILNSLWQGFLLWIICQAIIVSVKNASAAFKHNLSVLMILCSFAWFVFTFLSKLFISGTAATLPAFSNDASLSGNATSPIHKFLFFAESILPYLSIAYLFLLALLTVKLYAAYRHVHFISSKNLIDPPLQLKNFADEVASRLGIEKAVIWISKHIEVPATIGFFKPIILIPFASINQLTTEQLEAIILHEFSHIKRNDYLVNLFISIIETMLFFNPFIAVFVKTIKRERENCCDDFVLQYSYDPHSYATALLRLEQQRKNNMQLSLGAVSGKKQLLARIKRITGNPASQFNYGQKMIALIITTAIFCSFAWLSPREMKKDPKEILTKKVPQDNQATAALIVSPLSNENPISIAPVTKSKKNKTKIESIETNLDQTAEVLENTDKSEASGQKNELQAMPDETANGSKKETTLTAFNFKNFPRLQFESLNANIDYNKMNEEIQKAFVEINRINWSKLDKDIRKQLNEIKINELPETEKAMILKARKNVSSLLLQNLLANQPKVLLESDEQKSMTDSLHAAAATLLNQQPARFAMRIKKEDLPRNMNLNSLFIQGFEKAATNNKKKSINGEQIIEYNGKRGKINGNGNERIIKPGISISTQQKHMAIINI